MSITKQQKIDFFKANKDEIVKLYVQDLISMLDISKKFNVTDYIIKLVLQEQNIKLRSNRECQLLVKEKLTGRPTKLNNTEKQEVIRLYTQELLSSTKIGRIFNTGSQSIRDYIKNQNIPIRAIGESIKMSTKFSFNEMNKNKSFVVGLIYGDGSLSIRGDSVNITSGNIDIDLLEKTRLVFGEKFKIYKKQDNCSFGVIHSKKIHKELVDLFKLTNNKSDKLVFPNIKDEFMPSFISGYMAADGCIRVSKQKTGCLDLHLSFYSCSKQYLEDLRFFICNKANIQNTPLYERKNMKGHLGKKPLFMLIFNSNKAEKACEYIFKNTDQNTRCDRKYNIYKNYMMLKHNIEINY